MTFKYEWDQEFAELLGRLGVGYRFSSKDELNQKLDQLKHSFEPEIDPNTFNVAYRDGSDALVIGGRDAHEARKRLMIALFTEHRQKVCFVVGAMGDYGSAGVFIVDDGLTVAWAYDDELFYRGFMAFAEDMSFAIVEDIYGGLHCLGKAVPVALNLENIAGKPYPLDL